MTIRFDPHGRLIVIPVTLTTEWGSKEFHFALDTGATRTCVAEVTLRRLGIETGRYPLIRTLRGASGEAAYGEIDLVSLDALEFLWDRPTLTFTKLNTRSRIDGLLGLDFLRDRILTLDFPRGTVSLRSPSRWRFWR